MHTIDKYLSDMSKFEIIHVTLTNNVVQWQWFIHTNHKSISIDIWESNLEDEFVSLLNGELFGAAES